MPNKDNRFRKEAGLFDSPVVNPDAGAAFKKKAPKKWDERMTKRFIALETICPEIKYFAADFESWAREAFETDSEEYTSAVKLARKLSKTEALLYNIISSMIEMSKTGELKESKAFEAAFVKLAEDLGLTVEAEKTVHADCLPGCTCSSDAKCPDDPKCDNCKSCIEARGLEKAAGMDPICYCEDGINCPNDEQCQSCDACELKRQASTTTTTTAADKEEKEESTADEDNDSENKEESSNLPFKKKEDEENTDSEDEESAEKESNDNGSDKFEDNEEATAGANYEMQYELTQDETGKFSWLAAVKGTGYNSIEEAEDDLEHIFKNAIDRMDLEEEIEDQMADEMPGKNSNEERKVQFEDVDPSNVAAQEIAHADGFEEAPGLENNHHEQEVAVQKPMDDNKPKWMDLSLEKASEEQLRACENALEEAGIFALVNSKAKTIRANGIESKVQAIINEVLGE